MDSTIPLMIGVGVGAYLLLRKKEPPKTIVFTPSPPEASPTDLSVPSNSSDDVIDIQGFGRYITTRRL